MNTAAASLPPSTRLGAAWAKDPLDIEDWIRSARRVWKYLKHPRRQRKAEHTARDKEIGREIPEGRAGPRRGRPASRRTVQRGLWYLEHVLKAIVRDRSGGRGRVIRITLPLAGDDKEEKEKEKARAKEKARPAAPAPAPTPTPTKPPADPPPADDPPPDWEAIRRETQQAARDQAEAKAAAKRAALGPEGPLGVDAVEAAARALSAEEWARLEALEPLVGGLTSSQRKILEAARRIHAP
jgi:hypothetical protein